MANEKESSKTDEYELVPHREIKELKEELAKVQEFPTGPGRRMQVSMDRLADKVDRLISIFEESMHELKVEEGGLSFKEKMRPVMERMNRILDQNAEIASGIVALADMLNEVKGKVEGRPAFPRMSPAARPVPETPGTPPTSSGRMPPLPPGRGMLPPPPPPRRK